MPKNSESAIEYKYKHILIKNNGPVCTVTLNRPQVLNAINTELATELEEAFINICEDKNIKVVILTGAGRAFCSGRDLKEYQGYKATPLEDWEMRQSRITGFSFFSFLQDFEKPTIAAVNGFALAGGCELALGCDIRIASENARFGLPEINLRAFPGMGATYLLPDIIGRSRAFEMIFTGDMIDAVTAEKIGLVNKVVSSDQLVTAANDLAQKIAEKDLFALKLAKAAIILASGRNIKADMRITAALRALAETKGDINSAIKSVLNK